MISSITKVCGLLLFALWSIFTVPSPSFVVAGMRARPLHALVARRRYAALQARLDSFGLRAKVKKDKLKDTLGLDLLVDDDDEMDMVNTDFDPDENVLDEWEKDEDVQKIFKHLKSSNTVEDVLTYRDAARLFEMIGLDQDEFTQVFTNEDGSIVFQPKHATGKSDESDVFFEEARKQSWWKTSKVTNGNSKKEPQGGGHDKRTISKTLTNADVSSEHRPNRGGQDGNLSSTSTVTAQEDEDEDEVDSWNVAGTRNFAVFVLAIFFLLPWAGPRIPSFYHNTAELLSQVHQSAGVHGNIEIKVEKVFDPDEPKERGDLRKSLVLASARARDVPPKARLLIVANEHARELVTGEVALGVVDRLSSDSNSSKWRSLLQKGLEVSVLPVANPEGRQLAESGRTCQRGTADFPFATDLNRNFPTDWVPGVQLNSFNASLDTHGTSPFSAPQSRILREVAMRHQWNAFVDVHSGSLALNTPFGNRDGGSADLQEQLQALEKVRAICPNCKVGPLRQVMGYDNPGQMADWMYEQQHVKYSYVWEVFDQTGLCTPHFNPTDEAVFNSVVEQWTSAIAALGEYVLDHSAIPDQK